MSNWYSFGSTSFGSVGGAPYERVVVFPPGQQFAMSYRIGAETLLAKYPGQVIRAIDCAGSFNGMWVDGSPIITVRAAPGATKQAYAASVALQLGATWPTNNNWAINVPDATVPIGLMRTGAGQVNTNQWAGLSTSSFVVVEQNQAEGLNPLISRLRYLLSPKPRWVGGPPADLVQGGPAKLFTVLIQYPDGTPVVGLALRLQSEGRGVVFGDGTSYVAEAMTDSNGRIAVPVRALTGQPDVIILDLIDPRCAAEYFDPPLTGVFPINAQTTTVGGRQCVVLPAIPPVPYAPEVVTESLSFDWDAGAYSQLELDGDCEIVLTEMLPVVGAVVGFVNTTEDVTNYARITHGIYFNSSQNGQLRYQIMESGRAIGAAFRYYDGDEIRLQRVGAAVRYVVNGAAVYNSRAALTGPVRTGCSLFATGDSI